MVMAASVCFDGLAVRRAVRLEAIPNISFRLLCLLVGEKLFVLKPHNNIKVLLSEGPETEIRPKGQTWGSLLVLCGGGREKPKILI
jgi:hypothetical protein